MRTTPWATVFVMVVAIPLGAFAQPSNVDEARRHADAGEAALADQQFQRALQEYQAAYDLFPNALLLVNVARAQSGLGKHRDAIATLGRVLEDAGLDPARRTEVDTEIRRLRGLLVALTISVTPEGSHISVNGEDAGVSPLSEPVLADPGAIDVRVAHDGYRAGGWSGTLEGGARRTIPVTLEADAASDTREDPEPPDGSDIVAPPPPPPPERSHTLLWATGIGAGVTGVAALSIGTVLLAKCGTDDCEGDMNGSTVDTVSVIGDVLGGVAIVCAGVFFYALATSGDAEEAATTALAEPGTVRF